MLFYLLDASRHRKTTKKREKKTELKDTALRQLVFIAERIKKPIGNSGTIIRKMVTKSFMD